MEIILTHKNADFDAIAAMLGAYKLNPQAIPVLPSRVNRNVREFLTLYQNRHSSLPFVKADDFRPQSVKHIIVVDTQRFPQMKGVSSKTPITVIDHHVPEANPPPNYRFECDTVGAATTLLVERIQKLNIPVTPLEATLLMLGIYEDTGRLTYGLTTSRDIRAAAWLRDQHADLDTVRRFLAHSLDADQQALFEILRNHTQHRTIEGHIITVSVAKVDKYIPEINSVAHQLRDTLEVAALVVVVEIQGTIHLICRSSADAIDVSKITQHFGGGGHSRAASATIRTIPLDEIVNTIWQQLEAVVQPVVRVGDLMSYGAKTIDANEKIADVIQDMRRIGHEGFPVLQGGQVVGLITRRIADRTLEHQLQSTLVKDVMMAGRITLQPDDTITTLENRMVESGWGQIPVVNEQKKVIGIVTRTDLINHWARKHPRYQQPDAIPQTQVETVLGASIAQLIIHVAHFAQGQGVNVYLVGGVVRDLLLERRNLDIDFVVEGDAIDFATALHNRFGGDIHSYRPFGTAKWLLDSGVSTALGLSNENELPTHIDFATSRNEFYEHPTALPTVYDSSIKLDLQRRDFTINTLAVQLSPAALMWQIVDYYGGRQDLQQGIIRILHSLSFVDDPTRILRAVRFAHRLNFTIEARTSELIDHALPMLRRITGKRVRSELDLLLQENQPEQALLLMGSRNILHAIHPEFVIDRSIIAAFEIARGTKPVWDIDLSNTTAYYWHILLCHIPYPHIEAIADRLMLTNWLTNSSLAAARLVQQPEQFIVPDQRPGETVQKLEKVPEMALWAAYVLIDDHAIRETIQRYVTEWRYIQPTTTGHTLRDMGLTPGPRFRQILDQLRCAWLDGDIRSAAEEQALLHRLIQETESS